MGGTALDSTFLAPTDQTVLLPVVSQHCDTTDKLAVSRYTLRTLSDLIRHRAAIGLTEETDALVVVISEETGLISVAYNGRIVQRLDINRLRSVLLSFFQHQLGGRGWTKRV